MGRYRWFALGAGLALAVAVACGGDDDGSTAPSYAGQSKSLMVEAGKAAALTLGAVKLDVPEGAVSADVEVSVEISAKTGKPDAQKIAIDVYDFGPDGTTFDKAVKLEFELKGVDVGRGKKAVVAWLEDGKWNSLPTVVKNGKASAETTHFTPFTVLIETDSAQQLGGQCSNDFTPCGGDLTGTWNFTAACLNFPTDPLGTDSPFSDCDVKPVASFTFDVTGSATFSADGSFMNEQTSTVSGGFLVTKACLDQIAAEGGAAIGCSELGGTPHGEGDCLIGGAPDEGPTTETTVGTYRTEGSSLWVTEEGQEEEPSGDEYCVRGDTLTVRILEEDGGPLIQYTGTRVSR